VGVWKAAVLPFRALVAAAVEAVLFTATEFSVHWTWIVQVTGSVAVAHVIVAESLGSIAFKP
jgi:hypothetical protein